MLYEVITDEYIDSHGALDRARMREKVFSDAAAKKKLESILHRITSYNVCYTKLLREHSATRPTARPTLVSGNGGRLFRL